MKQNSIVKHFLNIGLGSIINVLLGFITTPLITRIVDPEVYGKITIFDTYSGIILSFIYFGLDQSLMRFFYGYDDLKQQKGLLKLCFGLPIIGSFIVFTIMYGLIKLGLLQFSFSMLIFALLIIDVLSSLLMRFSTSMLKLTYQSSVYSLSIVIQKIVYTIVIIAGVIIAKNNHLEVMIIATICLYLSSSIVSVIYTKKYWSFNDAVIPNNKNEVIKYGIPMIGFASIVTLTDSMDKFFVRNYCSEYELGIYASAFTLVSLFALLQTTFNSIWLPAQTEQFTKHPNDKTFIQKGNKYITLIMFFAAINVIMFKDVLCYILGESYRGAGIVMPFLIMECVMYTISDSTCSGIDISKRSYLNIIVSGTTLLFSFIVQSILVPRIGVRGAAIARAVAGITYFTLRTYLSNRFYYIDYGLKKYLLITIATIAMSYLHSFYDSPYITISSYIICMIVFVSLYFDDIKEMLNYFLGSIFAKNQ